MECTQCNQLSTNRVSRNICSGVLAIQNSLCIYIYIYILNFVYNYIYIYIYTCYIQALVTFEVNDTEFLIEETVMLTEQLAVITQPTTVSLLPSSLNTTNTLISTVLDVLETQGNNTADANEVRELGRGYVYICIAYIVCYSLSLMCWITFWMRITLRDGLDYKRYTYYIELYTCIDLLLYG